MHLKNHTDKLKFNFFKVYVITGRKDIENR